MSRQPDYGIDSPGIVIGLFAMSVLATAAGILLPRVFGLRVRWMELAMGAYFLAGAAGMLSYSKSGKLRVRDQILGAIPWQGNERVLDVGCGRGLLLLGAARRLTTGTAVGVDMWIPGAISGNRPEGILENARLMGVVDRVSLVAGDARRLPLQRQSIDVVVSNYVIHEVNTAQERQALITEILRVLKPGGKLAVVDFIFTNECLNTIQRSGIPDAVRTRVGGASYWLSAILSLGSTRTYLVTASKPISSSQDAQARSTLI
jgi:arsenite methyltransferase